MGVILEWILAIVSTLFVFKSINRLLNYNSNTVADYVMIVIYVFNCFPILLNIIFGLPDYELMPWYYYFNLSSNDELVQVLYSLYMLISILALAFYIRTKRNNQNRTIYIKSNSVIFRRDVLILLILIPLIYIIGSGNLSIYEAYGSVGARGGSNEYFKIINVLETISIYAFCCWYFTDTKKTKSFIWLIIYGFFIAWINGKRYIVVTILLLFVFFYMNSTYSIKKKINLKSLLIVFSGLFVLFYFSYAINVKNMATNTFDSLYLNFRIDFGRDDVTKFVLYKEVIENNPILEYRGQTIISTLLMFVPRFLWLDKPYPHYRYLTASLYDTSVENIPSGMTPSFYEMSVANFGVIFGMIIAVLFIVYACYLADKCNSIPRKALYLLLIVVLLTQSMDSVMIFTIILPISAVLSKIKSRYK